jgi:hypothetical protein
LTSRTTERFRSAYAELPDHIHTTRPIYSARVGLGYRALAVLDGDLAVWFWIGTHADYDRLLRSL